MDNPTTGSLRHWFEAALDQPAASREEWLRAHCTDRTMIVRVTAMLAAHGQTHGVLLDVPVAALIESMRQDEEETLPPEALIGTRVGAFRLLRRLGQGGMATVFLAQREGADFEQRVAVKLLRRGLQSAFQQRMFLRERRTLATLSHPDIARLIDGGVTETGVAYLVMDYIEGAPITQHATARQLGLRARLELFVRVCRAVDAAHRQLVVHRDIKPSNILVTSTGEARLLDFGIAKLLDDDGTESDAETSFGGLTPGYAAPEQYSGGVISTATDVYALGVLLHELLLGERPDSLRTGPPSQRATDAERPRWTLDSSRKALRSALRGDLDCLLMKAMAADPEQRYASAGALADDVQRHLRHEPIIARAPTTAYRMRKFAQRHRGGVSIVAVLTLALLASLSAALWQTRVAREEAFRARAQTQLAREQATRATAVRDLLVELFENENPGGARAHLPDTATLLQRGAARAHEELAATPALQVEMLVTIGRVYDRLSQYDQARPLLEKALVIARRLPAEDSDSLVDALAQLGQLELSQKRYAKALPLLDEALRLQRPHCPEGLTTASLLHQRALLYSETDRHAEAIADYRASLAIRQQRLRPDHPQLIASYGALGTAYTIARQHRQALPWLQRALESTRRINGQVHDDTARRLSNLGLSLLALDRYEEAERVTAEAVAISRQVYAGPNAAIAPRLHNLGSALLVSGRLDDAETSLREALAVEKEIGRAQSPGVGFSLAKLTRIQELRGDLPGALRLALESERILSASLPPTHALRLDAELRALRLRLSQDHMGTDGRSAIAALQLRITALPDAPPALIATAHYVQGLAALQAGDDRAAIIAIEQALSLREPQGSFPQDMIPWFITLAQIRQRQGDAASAQRTLQDAGTFADLRRIPATHPARLPLTRMLALSAGRNAS